MEFWSGALAALGKGQGKQQDKVPTAAAGSISKRPALQKSVAQPIFYLIY
jgi:hypothetical protein